MSSLTDTDRFSAAYERFELRGYEKRKNLPPGWRKPKLVREVFIGGRAMQKSVIIKKEGKEKKGETYVNYCSGPSCLCIAGG